jgi:hypothetical protein
MPDLHGIVEKAINFDMSDVLERYAKDYQLPMTLVAEHEREIKRFLALCSAQPGRYGMKGPMDELWHVFIIFTEKYAAFCEALGGPFIHHTPALQSRNPEATASNRDRYARFLDDYREVFAEDPPPHLWPRPLAGEHPSCNNCGIGCDHKCVA